MPGMMLLKLSASIDCGATADSALPFLPPTAETWNATEGGLTYIYLKPEAGIDATMSVEWIDLEMLTDLPGPDEGALSVYHYVVETDVLPAFEDEFNAWYDTEHLPGLAAVPGVIRARRFAAAAGFPRYYACYDFAHDKAFASTAWMAVRATPWSSRIREAFRNTQRNLFSWAARGGAGLTSV